MKMALSNVKRGPVESPFSLVLYGPEGIGKSTFAAGAPSPIFLGTEDGTGQLDIARFPSPDNWSDVGDALRQLKDEKHDFQTLVIDTLDWLEPLIHAHVCEEGGKASIEDFGFGKGYALALEQWRLLLKGLSAVRQKAGMHVIMLAHSQVKTFRNPAGEDYDRHQLKIHSKAEGLVKEWPDAVLFGTYKTFQKKKESGALQMVGNGARVVYTEHRPAWDAKNRYGLPFEMPLDWSEFEAAARNGSPASADALKDELALLIKQAPESLADKATASMLKVDDDPKKLAILADWLRAKLSEQGEKAA